MAPQSTQLEKREPTGTGKSAGLTIPEVWSRLQTAWSAMPAEKRRLSMVAFVAMAVLLGIAGWWGLRTDWRTLYSGLEAEDARQVGLMLTQALFFFVFFVFGL